MSEDILYKVTLGIEKKKILFICTHNSARSQIAEGFVNSFFSENYEAYSAGTKVAFVRPYAISVMQEIGVDISKHRSKHVRAFYGKDFDLVVTVCDNAKKICPVFPGAKRMIHQSFEDPSSANGTEEEMLKVYRKVRDQIKIWLIENLNGLF